MFCARCGKEVTEGNAFCRVCGNKIISNIPDEVSAQLPIEQNTKKTSLKKTCKIIGYIYGTIALIAFLLKAFGVFPQFYKEGDNWTVNYRGFFEEREGKR